MRGELLDLAVQVGVELGRLFAHEARLGLALRRDDASLASIIQPRKLPASVSAARSRRQRSTAAAAIPGRAGATGSPGAPAPGAPGPGTPGPGAPGPCGVLVTAGASRGWP
ncbi:hypothetical protein [Microbacterium lacticum]